MGSNVYIGDRVLIFQAGGGGPVTIGDRVCILRDTIIETGDQGSLQISNDVYIHPRCQINTYKVAVKIGDGVLIAANCALYSHEHGIVLNRPIREQPLYSKGPIIIGDHAWLGTGAIVLGGVTIGEGAVVGAGAVVTKDIPDNCIALGVPARVVGKREPDRENFNSDSESAKPLVHPSGSKRKVMT
jgi:acetyltransferase-like isoleucine patch superfamily enzyme